jgi:ectonucleotide pyrophosphatase/phosphodiesterase family protein 5
VERFLLKYCFHLLISLLFLACQPSSNDNYILLVSFDGFRADYSDSVATPGLDLIASEGVRGSLRPVFPSNTFPNHYSIATGLYPAKHGLVDNQFFDPQRERWYRLRDSVAVSDGSWYGGEPIWATVERHGLPSATYFWVGSEAKINGYRPRYYYPYVHRTVHQTKRKQLNDWLQLPQGERPRFISLYFHDTDGAGHRYGPQAEATRAAVQQLDSVILAIRRDIRELGLADKLNLIVVSDHGMIGVSKQRMINIDEIINSEAVRIAGLGPLLHLYCHTPEQRDALYRQLRDDENHYRVYRRDETPERWHYRHNPRIGDLLVVADAGWLLMTDEALGRGGYRSVGAHGYDNYHPAMQGIFFAEGPAFQRGFNAGHLRNIDLYPLICALLQLADPATVDGNLDSIAHVLRAGFHD